LRDRECKTFRNIVSPAFSATENLSGESIRT
jgi:hypothetical protein